MNAERLIDAWLDDTLDDSGMAELEQQLRDPLLADQLVRAAHFRHSLRRLVVQQVHAGKQQEARPASRRQATSRQPLWRWGLAACLCTGIGIGLVAALRSTGTDQPSMQGRSLASGEIVEAGTAPVELQWRDGSRIELAPGSALTIAAGPGKQLELQRGSIQGVIARQAAAAPLVIHSADSVATIAEGVFTVARTAVATRLSVVTGTTMLERSRDGFRTAVESGGLCILPLQGTPYVQSAGIASTSLDTLASPVARSALGGPADTYRLATEPGISTTTAARVVGTYADGPLYAVDQYAKSWILLRLAPVAGTWDLSAHDGIEFWFRGPSSGTTGRIWIEIVCFDPHVIAPDHETHFVAAVPDAAPGWRFIRLPWSAFTLREWPERPAETRLLPASVMQINIMQLGVRDPDFAVDELAAWSARPLPR